jgi:hypothetical protein
VERVDQLDLPDDVGVELATGTIKSLEALGC